MHPLILRFWRRLRLSALYIQSFGKLVQRAAFTCSMVKPCAVLIVVYTQYKAMAIAAFSQWRMTSILTVTLTTKIDTLSR
jgi:hypothetical protein